MRHTSAPGSACISTAIVWAGYQYLRSSTWTDTCTRKVTDCSHCSGFLANNSKSTVRFQVLMAVSMKMAVFWVVVPCSLVEVYQCFTGACCLHHQRNELSSLHHS
jgi:hypothetical protein